MAGTESKLTMQITDSQIHLWAADSPERPWPDSGRAVAHGEELLEAEVLRRMEEAGVDRAVLVPPSFEGDRNDVCLAAAAAHPDRFAVMGRIALEQPQSRDLVEGWLDQPGMVGARFTFHRPAQRAWLRDGTADWFWPEAERLGIPVMILVPESIPEAGKIAERHPDLRLVIDHLAVLGIRDEAVPPALEPLYGLARYPNVAVKASCTPNLVSEPYPFASLAPHLERIVETFGPRRVFWGSDLSRLTCTLRECVTHFTEALPFLSEEDKSWIMGRGVSEWLGWPP